MEKGGGFLERRGLRLDDLNRVRALDEESEIHATALKVRLKLNTVLAYACVVLTLLFYKKGTL